MYKGIVTDVFIPGVVNTNGSYSGIMEAKYIGFKICLIEHCSDNFVSKYNAFVNKIITVIELDTAKTAAIHTSNRVLINSAYFEDACQCMMSINDSETYLLLNLSEEPCIKLDK